MTGSLLDDDSIFGKQPPGLIDRGGFCLDKAATNTADGLKVCLFLGLMGNESHSWSAYRFTDGGSIVGVILVGHEIGLDKSGMNAVYGMIAAFDTPGPVGGCGASLHAHEALGPVGEEFYGVMALECLTHNDLSLSVHGVDANGKAVLRKTLRRDHVIPFFANRPECLVGGGMRQFGLLGARH